MSESETTQQRMKRGRGRPRKYPKSESTNDKSSSSIEPAPKRQRTSIQDDTPWDDKPNFEYLYLVPIRIDLDDEGIRVIDFFSWNLNETQTTSEEFAEWYCKDMKLPDSMIPLVVKSLQVQIEKYQNVLFNEHFLRRLLCYDNDLLLTINLDVRLHETQLKDQFEWFLLNNESTPEEFAQKLCEDIHLNPSFIPIVSNAIREQIYQYIFQKYERYSQLVKKDGQIDFEDVVKKAEPIVTKKQQNDSGEEDEDEEENEEDVLIRDEYDIDDWKPKVELLDSDELDKIAAREERESRYRRRDIYGGRQTRMR
jgi:hypothetical protein